MFLSFSFPLRRSQIMMTIDSRFLGNELEMKQAKKHFVNKFNRNPFV